MSAYYKATNQFSIVTTSTELGKSYKECKEQLKRLLRTVWTDEQDRELLKLTDEHTDLTFIACQIGRTVDSCCDRLKHLDPGLKIKEVYTFFGEMKVKISLICPPQNTAFLSEVTVLQPIRDMTRVGIGANVFGHLHYRIVSITSCEVIVVLLQIKNPFHC